MADQNDNGNDDKQEEEDYDYIFGFGSIINTETHSTWLTGPTEITSLVGIPARIRSTFGFRRGWFFRSSTGFTALGIETVANQKEAMDINGVMFRVPTHMMNGFDKREVGYDRVLVPFEPHVEILSFPDRSDTLSSAKSTCISNKINSKTQIWIYVPQTSSYAHADEDHPILQSYVDTVLRGCLQWGGETMAKEFVKTTTFWSPFFLNDTPSSRRPWLYRKDYEMIDKILSESSSTDDGVQTFFEERRHPEEFASAFLLTRMRGMWSVPRRNICFTGREEELRRIHLSLTAASYSYLSPYESTNKRSSSTSAAGTLSRFEITGMGGVGKTQLATEYCHRHFPSYYGLIVWLTAQGAESVAAEYRRLVSDTTLSTMSSSATAAAASSSSGNNNTNSTNTTTAIKDKDTDEVVAEVKARLFRLEVPWLLVFDNLEDRSLLDKFVPRGGTKGHVLITTRLVISPLSDNNETSTAQAFAGATDSSRNMNDDDSDDYRITLRCFDPSDSAELLKRSAGEHNVSGKNGEHKQAAADLAIKLGHLPLALGVAAAYMRRCDVDCSEYLSRYVSANKSMVTMSSSASLGQKAVESSLSLSLDAIRREEPVAWETLRLLGWMGPGKITKVLLRSLLNVKNRREMMELQERQQKKQKEEEEALKCAHRTMVYSRLVSWSSIGAGGGSIATLSLFLLSIKNRRTTAMTNSNTRFGAMVVAAAAVGGAATAAALSLLFTGAQPKERKKKMDSQQSLSSSMPLQRLDSSTSLRSLMPLVDNESISFSADEYEQTDLIWNILKSFSLLTVREGKGSMHRLLAQALRSSQNEIDGRRNLEICICTVNRLWCFKPEQVGTWQDSIDVLEHVKAVVSYSYEYKNLMALETSVLSREAGVFSAMALNRFEEAQFSLELSLKILDGAIGSDKKEEEELEHKHARAEALHELGRVFRYQGRLGESEDALLKALSVLESLDDTDADVRRKVAATLHELGVIEEKKHNLDLAKDFLRRALDLRLGLEDHGEATAAIGGERVIQADCASTLHQLAALEVARKPPCLDKAEELLQEALSLSMSIGQRAATLKQRARVAIRRGDLDVAERSLGLALELYVELYGENALHVNVAAVKFQQGALAFQREQLEQAWTHYSECLRARRHVYAYLQGNHLEVSAVLHELGRVALSQQRKAKAREMLLDERSILDRLHEMSAGQQQRILHARLTNLTWLRKCAKEMGDDEEARKISSERSVLKRAMHHKENAAKQSSSNSADWLETPNLQREALKCRSIAREAALACSGSGASEAMDKLKLSLERLSREIGRSPSCPLQVAASQFHEEISESLSASDKRTPVLKACDDFRNVLRTHGIQVTDVSQSKGKGY